MFLSKPETVGAVEMFLSKPETVGAVEMFLSKPETVGAVEMFLSKPETVGAVDKTGPTPSYFDQTTASWGVLNNVPEAGSLSFCNLLLI
jgi:hypothetical protein